MSNAYFPKIFLPLQDFILMYFRLTVVLVSLKEENSMMNLLSLVYMQLYLPFLQDQVVFVRTLLRTRLQVCIWLFFPCNVIMMYLIVVFVDVSSLSNTDPTLPETFVQVEPSPNPPRNRRLSGKSTSVGSSATGASGNRKRKLTKHNLSSCYKDLGRWKPIDDLLLIQGVLQVRWWQSSALVSFLGLHLIVLWFIDEWSKSSISGSQVFVQIYFQWNRTAVVCSSLRP